MCYFPRGWVERHMNNHKFLFCVYHKIHKITRHLSQVALWCSKQFPLPFIVLQIRDLFRFHCWFNVHVPGSIWTLDFQLAGWLTLTGLTRIMPGPGWTIKLVSVTIISSWFGAEMWRYCCLALSSFMWPHFNESLFGSLGSLMCERLRLKILTGRRPLSVRDLGWQALQTAALELAVMELMRFPNHSTLVLWPLVAFSRDKRSSSLNCTLWLTLRSLRAIGSGRLCTSSSQLVEALGHLVTCCQGGW